MSSNIYEKPNLPMNVRYSKGARVDGGERKERLVDIYESINTLTEHPANFSTQGGRARTQKHLPAVQRKPFRAAAVILGLLCLVLVIGITGLSVLYTSIVLERDELKIYYSNLGNNYTQLQTELNQLTGDIRGKLCPEGWERLRGSCYYKSTEMKNWKDSRADCQKRKADLVIINNQQEQGFLSELNKHGDSWIGLQNVPTNKGWDQWEWRWVDQSPLSFTAWAKGQSVVPVNWAAVSIDQQGMWTITDNGSKQWICEKEVS